MSFPEPIPKIGFRVIPEAAKNLKRFLAALGMTISLFPVISSKARNLFQVPRCARNDNFAFPCHFEQSEKSFSDSSLRSE
jgi:hypothetical protein